MPKNTDVNIIAISGSLRRASINTVFLRACQQLAHQDVTIELYQGLGDLPIFNPDLDTDTLQHPAPKEVATLREKLTNADGIIIASPEYAHGITGALKNGIDWVVSSGEFSDKPVALFNTSPRATIAYAALKEVLKTADANILQEASIQVPHLAQETTIEDICTNAETSSLLKKALGVFTQHIKD